MRLNASLPEVTAYRPLCGLAKLPRWPVRMTAQAPRHIAVIITGCAPEHHSQGGLDRCRLDIQDSQWLNVKGLASGEPAASIWAE